MTQLSTQAKGLLLTTLGVLALTPDTYLVRIVELDSTTLLFWRGISTIVGLSFITFLQFGRKTPEQFKQIGKLGLVITAHLSASSFCFIYALHNTSVANTLVIISAAPMFAALYSKFFLKEKVALTTFITMIVVVCAIAAIVSDTDGNSSITGNCIALGAAMSLAGAFTLMRKAKDRNMVPATALSGIITLIIAGFLSSSIAITLSQGVIVFFMGLSSVIGFFLLTLGPRYITAPEVSLLMPLETVFGTLLVWIMLKEQPSTVAIIGGIVVISALTIHAFLSLRSNRARELR